jgi:hypothetical protein
LLAAVVKAFVRVPEPVRSVLRDEVAILGVGVSTSGWTSSARIADGDGRSRTRLIVLSGHGRTGDEIMTTCVHERAHAWAAPLAHEHSQVITAFGRESLLSLARQEGWINRAEQYIARDERLAVALTMVWDP